MDATVGATIMSDASFRDPFTNRALFYPPPLDNSFSLPTVYEWHAEHNKDSAAFIFAGDDGNITTIRWPQVARAARVASRIVVNRMELGNKSIRGSVIAILAPSGIKSIDLKRFANLDTHICAREYLVLDYGSGHYACELRPVSHFASQFSRSDCSFDRQDWC